MRRGGRRGEPDDAVVEALSFWELDFNQGALENPIPE